MALALSPQGPSRTSSSLLAQETGGGLSHTEAGGLLSWSSKPPREVEQALVQAYFGAHFLPALSAGTWAGSEVREESILQLKLQKSEVGGGGCIMVQQITILPTPGWVCASPALTVDFPHT